MLSDDVVPETYDIEMNANFGDFIFSGEEIIAIKIKKRTRRIVLNSKELKILDAHVRIGKTTYVPNISLNEGTQTLNLDLENFVIGKAALVIRFEGKNTDKLSGFYRSKYDFRGKRHFILSTQMEMADARSVFPCFDEPKFKAVFRLSVKVSKDLEVISNSAIKKVTSLNDDKLVEFFQTPKMSTYLLYLGIGKFEHVSAKFGSIKIRGVSVPGKSKNMVYAIKCAKRTLDYLQRYFDIPYPFRKLDLIAIPDFAAGAMENWGAITFRDTAVLVDEKNASKSAKLAVLHTVTHELVHQWFGDLVTMKWWDDIWLNESFAEFFSSKVLEHTYPEMEAEKLSFARDLSTALYADGMKATHPIYSKVNSPEEISALFDAITYQKGSAVLGMLWSFLGDEKFRDGLRLYLRRHQHSNADSADLWRALADVAGRNHKIIGMLKEFTLRPGYPIIYVRKCAEGFLLEQKRFTINKDIKEKPWKIPLVYNVNGKRGTFVLGRVRDVIKIKGAWIKLNAGGYGLYRTAYSGDLPMGLGVAEKMGELGEFDAWNIENDLFAFVRSGRSRVEYYLSFLEHFFDEPSPLFTISALSHLYQLLLLTKDRPLEKVVREAAVKHSNHVLDRHGRKEISGESILISLARRNAISCLGLLRDKRVLETIRKIFSASSKGMNTDPDTAPVAFALMAIDKNNREVFNSLARMYVSLDSPELRTFALSAIGWFRDPKLLKAGLKFAFSRRVRLQDAYIVPISMGANPYASKIVWAWLKRHWKKLMKLYEPGTMMLRHLLPSLNGMDNKSDYAEIKGFFSRKENMRADISLEVKKALERISENVRFVDAIGRTALKS